jgi:hypothetical protein
LSTSTLVLANRSGSALLIICASRRSVELAQGGILCGHRFALGLVCRVCSLAPLRAGRRVGVDFGSRRPDGGVGTLLAGLAGLGT